jgi:hypothetical protein
VVGALPVPDLPAGVPGVRQDLGDGAQRPGLAGTVPVPVRVVPGRARHTVLVEFPGDARRAAAGGPAGEDPPHGRRRLGIEIEPMQTASPAGMGGVRMRPRIDQTVPIRRPPAEMTALIAGLHPHRRDGPEPGPQNLTLRLVPEQHHQRLLHRIREVDRPSRLG